MFDFAKKYVRIVTNDIRQGLPSAGVWHSTREDPGMSKKTERIDKLVSLLQARGFVSVRELSALLGVSEMTVRRDLKALEKNYAAGVHGLNPSRAIVKNNQEYNILKELRKQSVQKEAIGRFAVSLLRPDDIVIIDTGTTTEQVAQHFPRDMNLMTLCYNINILMELQKNPGVRLLFAGGRYHAGTQMFESDEGIQFIRGLRAYKVFLSAAGVHPEMGITCVNSYEVPTKQAVIRSSLEKILLCDSSKFGIVRPAYFCDLAEINTIVTDQGLPEEWRQRIASMGITLHLV